jgi:SHAQKYF class myb-like DNA-binding protein
MQGPSLVGQGQLLVMSAVLPVSQKIIVTQDDSFRRGHHVVPKFLLMDSFGSGAEDDGSATDAGKAKETDLDSRSLRDLPRLTGKRRNINREPVRYWTEDEHKLFLAGVQKFGGRNYKALSEHIKTRTPTQVRTHLQKYLLKLQVTIPKGNSFRANGVTDMFD